jgi:hypothetical protein
MGFPAFFKTGAGSGSVLAGSVFGDSCAQIVPKSTNAAAANRILRTILAQRGFRLCRWKKAIQKVYGK